MCSLYVCFKRYTVFAALGGPVPRCHAPLPSPEGGPGRGAAPFPLLPRGGRGRRHGAGRAAGAAPRAAGAAAAAAAAVRGAGGCGSRSCPRCPRGAAAVQREPGQPRGAALAAGAAALRPRVPARRRRAGHRVSAGGGSGTAGPFGARQLPRACTSANPRLLRLVRA